MRCLREEETSSREPSAAGDGDESLVRRDRVRDVAHGLVHPTEVAVRDHLRGGVFRLPRGFEALLVEEDALARVADFQEKLRDGSKGILRARVVALPRAALRVHERVADERHVLRIDLVVDELLDLLRVERVGRLPRGEPRGDLRRAGLIVRDAVARGGEVVKVDERRGAALHERLDRHRLLVRLLGRAVVHEDRLRVHGDRRRRREA